MLYHCFYYFFLLNLWIMLLSLLDFNYSWDLTSLKWIDHLCFFVSENACSSPFTICLWDYLLFVVADLYGLCINLFLYTYLHMTCTYFFANSLYFLLVIFSYRSFQPYEQDCEGWEMEIKISVACQRPHCSFGPGGMWRGFWILRKRIRNHLDFFWKYFCAKNRPAR